MHERGGKVEIAKGGREVVDGVPEFGGFLQIEVEKSAWQVVYRVVKFGAVYFKKVKRSWELV